MLTVDSPVKNGYLIDNVLPPLTSPALLTSSAISPLMLRTGFRKLHAIDGLNGYPSA
ncbi:MAG: hypothetical protein ACJ74Z_21200 [Bryobacteraceae bacterium]|jgi:hypothetical protein